MTGDISLSRPPSQAVIAAVELSMRERLNISGPMRRIFGDEVGDAVKVLLTQEVQAAAPEVARAAEAAALRAAAERMDDLSRGTPLAAAITARAAAIRLDHWADELTDTDDRSK